MKKMEQDYIEEGERIRYQNAILISRLEQLETVEDELMKEIKMLKDKVNKNESEEFKRFKSKEEDWNKKEYQSRIKALEWIKEKEVLTQEVETCLAEKRTMKEELDRARLEIYTLR